MQDKLSRSIHCFYSLRSSRRWEDARSIAPPACQPIPESTRLPAGR
jgi:hypothetical protein